MAYFETVDKEMHSDKHSSVHYLQGNCTSLTSISEANGDIDFNLTVGVDASPLC